MKVKIVVEIYKALAILVKFLAMTFCLCIMIRNIVLDDRVENDWRMNAVHLGCYMGIGVFINITAAVYIAMTNY